MKRDSNLSQASFITLPGKMELNGKMKSGKIGRKKSSESDGFSEKIAGSLSKR